MRNTHAVGLILWRGGLLLAVGYVAFQTLRQVLTITDAQLEFAIAVVLTGVFFVFLSVVGEQVLDARSEKDPQP